MYTDPPRSRRAPHPDFAIGATLPIRGFQRSQLLPTVLVSAIVDEILRGRRYYYTGLRRYHAHVSMFRLEHMDASRTNDRSLASHYPGSALRMHTIPAGAPERVRPFRASRLHQLCPRRATRAPNATYVSISPILHFPRVGRAPQYRRVDSARRADQRE